MIDPSIDSKIRQFEPKDDSWLPLDSLLVEVFSSSEPQKFYEAIFELFCKFPEEDGSGVFWSALHGMEHFGGYEAMLKETHLKSPSMMSKIMLKRLANS